MLLAAALKHATLILLLNSMHMGLLMLEKLKQIEYLRPTVLLGVMIAQAQVNLEVFAMVLKAVLVLQYYCPVFVVMRVAALQMLSPLLTCVLVKVLMSVVVNVDLLKARERV